MQKDIDTLIKEFFDSVYSYTGKVSALQTNKRTKKELAKGIDILHKMQQEIEEIQLLGSRRTRQDRADDLFYMRVPMDNFIMPNSGDCAAYIAFRKMIDIIICALQHRDIFNVDTMMEPLNYWYTATSGNLGKDLQMAIFVKHRIRTK